MIKGIIFVGIFSFIQSSVAQDIPDLPALPQLPQISEDTLNTQQLDPILDAKEPVSNHDIANPLPLEDPIAADLPNIDNQNMNMEDNVEGMLTPPDLLLDENLPQPEIEMSLPIDDKNTNSDILSMPEVQKEPKPIITPLPTVTLPVDTADNQNSSETLDPVKPNENEKIQPQPLPQEKKEESSINIPTLPKIEDITKDIKPVTITKPTKELEQKTEKKENIKSKDSSKKISDAEKAFNLNYKEAPPSREFFFNPKDKNNSHLPKAVSAKAYIYASFEAVKNDDIDSLKLYSQDLKDLNFVDKEGNTLLIYSIIMNSKDAFYFLISNKIDINARNIYGATALHTAVITNNREFVSALIKAGANNHILDQTGKTPLDYADNLRDKRIKAELMKAQKHNIGTYRRK